MFYSQIILAKKGPLGKVWMAAHWGDKKLGRPAIFSTDISKSVDSIQHPSVPLALRVSSHLLLGVVRIYSRQVQYVLTDCHEAMVKLKLAFAAGSAAAQQQQQGEGAAVAVDLAETTMTRRASEAGHAVVANFGEYRLLEPAQGGGGILLDHHHQPFAIPFDLNNLEEVAGGEQWELAEEQQAAAPEDEEASVTRDGRRAMLETTLDESALEPQPPAREEEEEQQWTAFDPDAEDRHVFDDSRDVSSVEMVRGADSSLDTTGLLRASMDLDDHNNKPPASTAGAAAPDDEFPPPDNEEEEEEDMGVVPFDDEEEERATPLGQREPRDESGLGSLMSGEDGAAADEARRRRDSSIGGLDDTSSLAAEEEEEGKKKQSKRKKKTVGPKRMRKRRKVVIDNDETELSNEHIQNMLKDTSDICLPHRAHPAQWIPESGDEPQKKKRRVTLRSILPPERLLVRPFLGDDGGLAPELLQLWERNGAFLLGKPIPFRMRGDMGEAQRQRMAEAVMEGAAEAEEIELGRRGRDTEEVEEADHRGRVSVDDNDQMPPPDDDEEMPPPDDEEEEDVVVPFDDDEEQPPPPAGDQDEFATDMAVMMGQDEASVKSRDDSTISLGLVNDLGDELEEEDRQESGSDLASSTSKWHKHTVMVLNMLQRNMRPEQEDDDEEEEGLEPKPSQLSYDALSKGCSRRTAASVFFELLQLKTWDFVELGQDKSYGDITITPGVKFHESPPSTN